MLKYFFFNKLHILNAWTAFISVFIGVINRDSIYIDIGIFNLVIYYGEKLSAKRL